MSGLWRWVRLGFLHSGTLSPDRGTCLKYLIIWYQVSTTSISKWGHPVIQAIVQLGLSYQVTISLRKVLFINIISWTMWSRICNVSDMLSEIRFPIRLLTVCSMTSLSTLTLSLPTQSLKSSNYLVLNLYIWTCILNLKLQILIQWMPLMGN